ncbi:MAG: addiction module protein [Armatimonadetes bacterium]|nr:addiction module protein [Armatimonadota bacterium]
MKVEDLIAEAMELPVEERILIADSMLRSLNRPDPEVEAAWLDEAERRLAEIDAGRTTLIPGDEVMAELRKRITA